MLTFEKVLAAFKDYLEEDDRYTILMTPKGRGPSIKRRTRAGCFNTG